MSRVLSTWKAIANYLGKGVRTVQRWERELGLPIRRTGRHPVTIFALTEELDEWVKGESSHREARRLGDAEIASLQQRIADLERENEELRAALSAPNPARPNIVAYCETILSQTVSLQQKLLDTAENRRRIVRRLQREPQSADERPMN